MISANVEAAKTQIKNNYMRNPLAMDVFNEEICILLKKKIKASVRTLDDLSISFDYNSEVTLEDTEEILEKITAVHSRVLASDAATHDSERRQAHALAANLARSFYGFEPDFSSKRHAHRR
jgi:hypothetical protein